MYPVAQQTMFPSEDLSIGKDYKYVRVFINFGIDETSTIDGIDYQWICLVSRMSNLSLIKAWGTSDGRIMRHWSYRPIVVKTLTE